MLEQHGSTRLSRLARHVERVESCRDVTSQVEFGIYWTMRQILCTWHVAPLWSITNSTHSRTSSPTLVTNERSLLVLLWERPLASQRIQTPEAAWNGWKVEWAWWRLHRSYSVQSRCCQHWTPDQTSSPQHWRWTTLDVSGRNKVNQPINKQWTQSLCVCDCIGAPRARVVESFRVLLFVSLCATVVCIYHCLIQLMVKNVNVTLCYCASYKAPERCEICATETIKIT